MITSWEHFDQIWVVDFEFYCPPGHRPIPLCLVVKEIRSGQLLRLWQGQLGSEPPYGMSPNSLLVAYYASAEWGCHLSLGWRLPYHVLDLYAEFRCLTNGKMLPCGKGLLGALTYFGIDGI